MAGSVRVAPDGGPAEDPRALRWELLRDLAVFTGKVGLEALRDVALIPVGLAAGGIGLLFQPRDPAYLFRQVLALGDRFDRFVDIFGAGRRGGRPREGGEDGPSLDALAARLEGVLVEQYRKGGLTAQAKEAVDRALDTVQGRRGHPRPGPDP